MCRPGKAQRRPNPPAGAAARASERRGRARVSIAFPGAETGKRSCGRNDLPSLRPEVVDTVHAVTWFTYVTFVFQRMGINALIKVDPAHLRFGIWEAFSTAQISKALIRFCYKILLLITITSLGGSISLLHFFNLLRTFMRISACARDNGVRALLSLALRCHRVCGPRASIVRSKMG